MGKKKPANEIIKESTYIDLLYMTPYNIMARDIKDLLQGQSDLILELWDEMNILEIELPNTDHIDLESLPLPNHNPSDAAFVKERNISAIFTVNLLESDLNTVISIFEKIIVRFSGFLCADTEDFAPVYIGTSKIYS